MRQYTWHRARACGRWPGRLAAIALTALLLAGCDGSAAQTDAPDQPSDEPAAAKVVKVVKPAPPAPTVAARSDPLEGTWWALAPDLPYMAFRANLIAPERGGDELVGSWVSFDWRRSPDIDSITRLSKPVAIIASRDGNALALEGPAPMLDANGIPNGHAGRWSLTLRRISLPGDPLRFAGHSRHDKLSPSEGLPVELVREFRAWKKP